VPHERRCVRWILFLFLAGLAVLAQTTLVRLLAVGGARPDLVLAVLVPFCVGSGREAGFGAGCVAGLARDLMTCEPFGLSTGVFGVLGYALARSRSGVFAEHPLTHGVLGFVCSCVSSGASVLSVLAEGGQISAWTCVRQAGVAAMATGVLSAVVGWAMWRRARWFGLRRRVEFQDV